VVGGGGRGGRYVLLRRTSGSQCSEGSGGWGWICWEV